MRILITGNMGYVGPVVTRHLRSIWPDADLIGYDMGYFAHRLTGTRFLPEILLNQQHFGDVRSFPVALLKGVDAILHLAAISNDPMGNMFEKVTFDINHRASVELATQAKKAGVRRFVFASSCSVYGSAAEGARNESSSLDPLTAYAKSKVLTEQDLSSLADEQFQVTSLRFATACGMSARLRLDLVLNDFVASAVATGKIVILSDGSPWRPLIHVADMARAMEWALGRELTGGSAYLVVNTGSDSWNYQVKTLADVVHEALQETEVSVNPSAPADKRSYRVDFSLFRSLAPAHQPVVQLKNAVSELGAALEEMGFRDRNFRQSEAMRLQTLSSYHRDGLLNENLEWVPNFPLA